MPTGALPSSTGLMVKSKCSIRTQDCHLLGLELLSPHLTFFISTVSNKSWILSAICTYLFLSIYSIFYYESGKEKLLLRKIKYKRKEEYKNTLCKKYFYFLIHDFCFQRCIFCDGRGGQLENCPHAGQSI
jgi:hypothetical protein